MNTDKIEDEIQSIQTIIAHLIGYAHVDKMAIEQLHIVMDKLINIKMELYKRF